MRVLRLLVSFLMLVSLVHCREKAPEQRDQLGNNPEGNEGEGQEEDTISPTVGTGITFSAITDSSITVSVGAGSDETTSGANLSYKFVKSDTAVEIDSITEVDAISGGALLQDWTANSLSVVSNSLTENAEYCFAALVKDEAGNKALYTPDCESTSPAKLKIFVTDTTSIGDLEGIFGADVLCATDINKPDSATYLAFLNDDVWRKSKPTEQFNWVLKPNRSYYRVDGTTLIATTTSQAIFNFPLVNAIDPLVSGAFTGIDVATWDSTGTGNCLGWTTGSVTEYGMTGRTDMTTANSITNFDPNCSFPSAVICVEQPKSAKRIFVTALAYNGNLGGVSGADVKCMDLANYPGTGTFKAMISDGTTRIGEVGAQVDWVLQPNTDYARLDGTPIGTTTADGVFTSALTNSVEAVDSIVWTSLKGATWSSGSLNCLAWTSSSNSDFGEFGHSINANLTFVDSGGNGCDLSRKIYCVEQ